MASDDFRIRRLLISDASLLREAEIYTGSIISIENKIREMILDKSKLAYVILHNDLLVCLATMIPTCIGSNNVRLNILFSSLSVDPEYYEKVISLILYKGFFDKKFHKISLVIGVNDYLLASAAVDCGMIQEAVLHDEILNDEDEYIDAGLFYALLPEYKGYNVGFVPFQRGVVAIYGADTYVDGVSIYRYEDKIDDYLSLTVAKHIGIADKYGFLLPRNDEAYSEINDDEFLPDEVAKAVLQMKEYFLKKREKFEINCRFVTGTSFQHSVWRLLNDIDYGVTVSYEDIALKLTSNTNEARKLTRAVGSACSENPIPIIIPCHRVIGKDGKLVGYSGGIDIKDFLLQHESLFTTVI
ncbi:MAG: methylated-DNA--[protein]-cysteine S-methyltransferase [Clostridia bacterium]|nr:methylated-DNA--[protein]-cysteine S-methyltransferase [Clostridia bacterium]